jgi:alpha-mannosidase
VGPWYVLADEFLVGPESHLRNLLIGRQVARRFGEPMSVGYLPDAFGHIAQMPQILRRAGIDTAVFTRGMGDEIDDLGWEHRWQAPDGSEVLALNQCGGYCAAGGLGLQSDHDAWTDQPIDIDRAVAKVQALFEQMQLLANGSTVQISNGCDHLPPQREFAVVIRALRDAIPGTEIRVGTLDELMRTIRSAGVATKVSSGERRGGKHQFILAGVWSSRVYLKQLNERCETLLSRVLEPLACFDHFIGGRPYPSTILAHLWRSLLHNHPHDSICGCSIDEVHREMVGRFESVLSGGTELSRQLLPAINPPARSSDSASIVVFNPLPAPRTAIVRRLLALPAGTEPSRLILVDDGGAPVPLVITAAHRVGRFWGRDFPSTVDGGETLEWFERYRMELPERFDAQSNGDSPDSQWIAIEFEGKLAGVGAHTFRLAVHDESLTPVPIPSPLAVDEQTLENDLVRATLHPDGRVDVLDKQSGLEYHDLNRLESTEDTGDEYDYAPAQDTQTVTTDGLSGTVRVVSDTGLRATLETTYDWHVPHGLTDDRRRRAEQGAACPVRIRIALERSSPLVELEVAIANRATDHRIRSRFLTDLQATHIRSDGHFYVNERPMEIPQHSDWVQPPTGTYPQQEFSAIHEGEHGLAILSRGLHEIAPIAAGNDSVGLAVTLLRAVGWLSRDDLRPRKNKAAGPMIPTPEAQCIGVHRFQLGIMPFSGALESSGVRERSAEFRVPPLSLQTNVDRQSATNDRLIEVSGPGVGVSAIKPHEERDTLVVRVYNTGDQPTQATLELGASIASVWSCSLLEDRLSDVAFRDSTVEVPLSPHEIATIEIAFT